MTASPPTDIEQALYSEGQVPSLSSSHKPDFKGHILYLSPLSHVEVTSQDQEVSATGCNLETCHPPQLDLGAGIFPEKRLHSVRRQALQSANSHIIKKRKSYIIS